jgi:chemotaxis protein CheD
LTDNDRNDNKLVIGVSDQKVGLPPSTLVTYALGSCVGIMLHDPATGIGGMAHVMLPDSSMSSGSINRMKFVDTAIPDLLETMVKLGAKRDKIRAKLTGGANMFKIDTNSESGIGSIGDRNVKRSKEVLMELGIPIIAEDTGADFGRTVYFDTQSGSVTVQSIVHHMKEI